MSVKTSELTPVKSMGDNDSYMVDNGSGTACVHCSDASEYFADRFASGAVPYGKEIKDDWASLQKKIQKGDFSGIHIGDYKEISIGGNTKPVVMEVAGIDTYYNCGDQTIKHHIDFISRDCLKGAQKYNSTDNNNGNATKSNPWLASELWSFLNHETTGIIAKIPSDLKAVITDKRALLEKRYDAKSPNLTNSNGWVWDNMGKLWIPTEREVFGSSVWSDPSWSGGGGCNIQYPIFKGGSRHLIKGEDGNGGRVAWWVASARRASSAHFCYVGGAGDASGIAATRTDIRVAFGFRIS